MKNCLSQATEPREYHLFKDALLRGRNGKIQTFEFFFKRSALCHRAKRFLTWLCYSTWISPISIKYVSEPLSRVIKGSFKCPQFTLCSNSLNIARLQFTCKVGAKLFFAPLSLLNLNRDCKLLSTADMIALQTFKTWLVWRLLTLAVFITLQSPNYQQSSNRRH